MRLNHSIQIDFTAPAASHRRDTACFAATTAASVLRHRRRTLIRGHVHAQRQFAVFEQLIVKSKVFSVVTKSIEFPGKSPASGPLDSPRQFQSQRRKLLLACGPHVAANQVVGIFFQRPVGSPFASFTTVRGGSGVSRVMPVTATLYCDPRCVSVEATKYTGRPARLRPVLLVGQCVSPKMS